jgi:hypothetical protein
MFLAGIWHGAGLQFIVYGVLHGIYLNVNHAWRIFRKPFVVGDSLRPADAYSVLWRVVLTYCAVLLAQIFFRADSTSDAATLVAGMLGFHGSGLPLIIPLTDVSHLGPFKEWLMSNQVLAVGIRDLYNSATLPLLENWGLIFGLGLIAFGAPNVYQMLNRWSPALTKVKPTRWHWAEWQPTWMSACAAGFMLFVAAQYFDRSARFLYFQF